jgi:hypothetical protein
MPESIQELLIAAHYRENTKTEHFDRGEQHIPYRALIGHTVDSFREKARAPGWLAPFTPPPVVVPYLGL